MVYLSLKAIHIFAAIFWVGSLCLVSFITSNSKMNEQQMSRAIRVTDTSIGFTWIAGIVLVVMGSWYTSSWWYIKVFLVVLISAIHTVVHRRWKAAGSDGTSTNGAVPYFILALTFLVVVLAVFKRPM